MTTTTNLAPEPVPVLWSVLAQETTSPDLAEYLCDPPRRSQERQQLRDDMEALPPWLGVRQATAGAGEHMNGLYEQAEDWLDALEADEIALRGLSDRVFCAELAARDAARGQDEEEPGADPVVPEPEPAAAAASAST